MLKFVVCVKAVPDPKQACNLKIDPVTKTLLRCDVPMVLNPLDKHALEAALQIKAENGAHICALSMGPPDAGSIVKECMALGADKGILLCDPCFGGADVYATAYTLAKGVQKIGDVDAVFCGMASSDGATEWVGPEMAVMLGMPVVTRVREIIMGNDESWEVKASAGKWVPTDADQAAGIADGDAGFKRSQSTEFFGHYQGQKKGHHPVGTG